MAALRTFYQRIIDSGASQSLSSGRPLAGPGGSRRNINVFFRRLLGASIAIFGLACASAPAADAANFTCSWNDATANWTTVADWSSCNGTDPNNVGGNTYDVIISQGDPTLTSAVTIGSVTINSPGAWTVTGASASATLTGLLSNAGTFALASGASLTTIAVGLTDTGSVRVDQSGGGGSSLTIGGALILSGLGESLQIGNAGLTASSTVQATSVSNAGGIVLIGNGAAHAELNIAGALTNTGFIGVDGPSGGSGSSLTVGGTLTNSGAGAILDIGNPALTASSMVTATGLSNSGAISLAGNGAAQAGLNITGAPAPATWTGTANLSGNALLQFAGTSQIGAIGSGAQISLTGPQAFVAAAGINTTSNSALTGLSSNAGSFFLQSGASLTTIGVGLANTGSVRVDQSGGGGSSLTIGGALILSGLGESLQIGNAGLTASSTVEATSLSNAGTIVLVGNGAAHAELNIAGALTNTGDVLVDGPSVGSGGSSLMVGGTLTNSGAGAILDIGNPALTASSTVTATGLSNSGTINLAGNTSVHANQATVTVNGQASNAGTINIPSATGVTVTGAGNSYTQTAGFTNLSGGTVTAPNVNITGGKLQGMGTVTGAANISGTGTIEAIDLANNSLPAALAINGNYGQSGGTFDALLHGTGIQIDEVNVTNGHSVTLAGGDLEAFGVTFALGQVFEDIMTFQPGELSGTFATLQGGGNGTSVDLGHGLTLEAIYDNAGGDISLEVVSTVPVPAPPIGRGVPVFLAVSGMLFGAKFLERRRKRRSLKTTPHTEAA
jgi:hypothetical protein